MRPHVEDEFVAIGFHLFAEVFVALDLASRELERRECDGCRIRSDRQPLAIHVVAVSDAELDLNGLPVHLHGGKAESLLGWQELVSAVGRHAQHRHSH